MSRNIPSLKRSQGKRGTGKRTFYLICEGTRTEPEYFRAISATFKSSVLRLEIVTGAGTAMKIAQTAGKLAKVKGLTQKSRRKLESYELNDEVWAVFDRDTFPQYDEALELCKSNNVNIARSNPCFEVWLLLHFGDFERDGDSKYVQTQLAKVCPGYSRTRNKSIDCTAIMSQIEAAERRAEKQLQTRAELGSLYDSPSTTVFELTRKLRGVDS